MAHHGNRSHRFEFCAVCCHSSDLSNCFYPHVTTHVAVSFPQSQPFTLGRKVPPPWCPSNLLTCTSDSAPRLPAPYFYLTASDPSRLRPIAPFCLHAFRPHPAFFHFRCKQTSSTKRRKGHAWATLGWPLGHAWVTQGPPRPNPNPRSAEGCKVPKSTKRNGFPLRSIFSPKLQAWTTGEPRLCHYPLLIIANRSRKSRR